MNIKCMYINLDFKGECTLIYDSTIPDLPSDTEKSH